MKLSRNGHVATDHRPDIEVRDREGPDAASRGARVALVTHGFPLVSETFVADLFERLLDRGWDVHIVAPKSDAGQWRFFPELARRAEARSRVHSAADVERTLRALRPALVHFQFGNLAVGRLRLCRGLGARSIVSFRGFDICFHGLEDPDYYREVWNLADALHLVSRDLWERAVRRGCSPRMDHAIIADAIDVDAFADAERRYPDPVGTVLRPLRLLSVGRLVWKKGHEYGLQSLRLLIDQGLHCELRIVGEGEHRSAIVYAIHDLGLDNVVHLLGARPALDVRKQLRWADVLMHPSVSEGFGVAVIEAQAAGLPVVCSDAEGLAENVAHGETGFVVPRRDPHALAAKIRLLAGDRDLRQRLGEAGRRRARRFDLADQIAAFERLYTGVLDVQTRARALSSALLAAPAFVGEGDEVLAFDLERAFDLRVPNGR